MKFLRYVLAISLTLACCGFARPAVSAEPARLIFDTDMGNDIDDALALAMIHALQSRNECRLLAVTLSKGNAYAAPFVDLLNTFYGRGSIPVGRVLNGKTPEPGKYLKPIVEAKNAAGKPLYPHRIQPDSATPETVALLRKTLAAQPDGSVAIAMVGFSTNLARLLDSAPDDVSPLSGRELAAKKVTLLSTMAGHFKGKGPRGAGEYNVVIDIPAAQKVIKDWPSLIVMSPWELGDAIKYPAVSIERDYRYVAKHPVAEAYRLYMKFPYDRQTWDLTSVLYAVRPDRGYFGLSEPGTITVTDTGKTEFAPSAEGRHRILTASPEQVTKTLEAMVCLCSEPPVPPKPPKTGVTKK
ncbi:MAG: nucleoside hydrolase [Verrucomicrobia bacterium]|nr:nucleoside hydrolase [Verrucomicrobiota bacterium]